MLENKINVRKIINILVILMAIIGMIAVFIMLSNSRPRYKRNKKFGD